MKKSLTFILMLGVSALLPVSAYALNSSIEESLKSRPDLSTFYQALVSTGVNNELQEGVSYTIFAPTNAAFARLVPSEYPCLYSVECRAEIAQVLRNHIVSGRLDLQSAENYRGGFYSINNHFANIGEPEKDYYTVDGYPVISTVLTDAGILYKVDGVIASERELASLESLSYGTVVPRERGSVISKTTEDTIPDPACGAEGCPDKMSETTTFIYP